MNSTDNIEIGKTRADEAGQIVEAARQIIVFSAEEVDTVRELLDDYLAKGDASQYQFLSCRLEGQVVGFACYGPRALTRSTYDFYWLGTVPSAQRRGVGRALMRQMEDNIRAHGGRLVILETSGLLAYEPARRFYDSHGYRREAVIEDFYNEGDDLVLYSKRLNP